MTADVRVLEIACDESGYEGDKLIGSTTDVFAHGSVVLDYHAAAACMQQLRDRIRSPATEYKANHVLREKHRSVLMWLLGPAGPLLGRSHVYLIDKTYFVLGRIIDVLLGRPEDAARQDLALRPSNRAMALTLYRETRGTRQQWEAFLAASNDLLRAKDRPNLQAPVDVFFGTLDTVRGTSTPGLARDILDRLRRARPRAESLRADLLDQPAVTLLDPLIPAIVRAVAYWGDRRHTVSIVHDQQNTLTVERIAQIRRVLSGSRTGPAAAGGDRMVSLSLVDSMLDPRVQVADVLTGAVRKLASDELNDHAEAELTRLLRPYVDQHSSWGDERSWHLFTGARAIIRR